MANMQLLSLFWFDDFFELYFYIENGVEKI